MSQAYPFVIPTYFSHTACPIILLVLTFFMQLPSLKGSLVCLRALQLSDVTLFQKYANDKEVSCFLPHLPHPLSLKDARDWINTALQLAEQDSACQFIIEPTGISNFVGVMGLKNINPVDRNAEIEYWLGKHFGEEVIQRKR